MKILNIEWHSMAAHKAAISKRFVHAKIVFSFSKSTYYFYKRFRYKDKFNLIAKKLKSYIIKKVI